MSVLKVELLDHMGDDLAVANAARVSTAKESTWDQVCLCGQTEPTQGWPCTHGGCSFVDVLKLADDKLIHYLASHHHWTPFSQTAVKFRCAAPIFLARQLFKHKVGLTENEVSRRYVDDAPEFFKPQGWRRRAPKVKQGSSAETVLFIRDSFGKNWYPDTLWDDHCKVSVELYNNLLNSGVCPEQARMVLPQGMMTEWVWTGNVASFARVFHLRNDGHAQREAQDFAKLLGDHMARLFPVSWSALTHG